MHNIKPHFIWVNGFVHKSRFLHNVSVGSPPSQHDPFGEGETFGLTLFHMGDGFRGLGQSKNPSSSAVTTDKAQTFSAHRRPEAIAIANGRSRQLNW
jgi:hypothetical protein